jgi:transposase
MTSKTLYVGIDLSLRRNQISIVTDDGKQIASFSVGNDLPGAKQLVQRLLPLIHAHHAETIKIGMEATAIYWWHIHQFLTQNTTLNTACAVSVHTLNPKHVHRFQKAYPDIDKTDPLDAMVIADYLRFRKDTPVVPLIDTRYEPLKRLTRFRYHLVHTIVDEKNYFINHLFYKYSSWQDIKPFSSPFGVTASHVITEMDPEKIVTMSINELATEVITQSHNCIADPGKTAHLIQKVASSSYQLTKTCKEPIDIILTTTYDNIRYLSGKVAEIDKVIAKEIQRFQNPLVSVNGIGPVFAAGITAEIGDPSRFTGQSAIGKYAGLTWRKTQSGTFTADETPRVKTGNSYLRYYLVQAANSLRIHNETYKAYYKMKYTEVPRHSHKRALVLTARKLARLSYAMLRDGRLYQPSSDGT